MSGIGLSIDPLAWVSSLIGAESQRQTNEMNMQINRENNDFNAAQASISRQFNAEQSQIARQWDEDMYNKYNSPEALVEQYRNAGLNPALMYSKGASGQFSGSSSAATSSPASAASPIGMRSPMDALTLSQANLNNARAANLNSDTQKKGVELEYLPDQLKNGIAISEQQIELYKQQIQTAPVERALKKVGISQIEAETSLTQLKQITESMNQQQLAITLRYADEVQRLDIGIKRAQEQKSWSEVDKLTAEYEKLQADTAKTLVEIGYIGYDAESRRISAIASDKSGEAALQNAYTATGELEVAQKNAETNRMNADTNAARQRSDASLNEVKKDLYRAERGLMVSGTVRNYVNGVTDIVNTGTNVFSVVNRFAPMPSKRIGF